MSRTENDQRVRLTKMIIKKTFVEILQKKPLKKVTVREICDLASINRGTFYNHYVDAFDLMEQMITELLTAARNVLTSQKNSWEDNNYTLCYNLFSLIKENKAFVWVLLKDHTDDSLANRFVRFSKEEFFAKYKDMVGENDMPLLDSFFLFATGGCFALLRRWFENNTESSTEALSRECGNLISFGWTHLQQKFGWPTPKPN